MQQNDEMLPTPALPRQGPAESSANALQFFNQHKFVVISCLVLGVAAGTLYAYRQTPIYAATAKVHIDRREMGAVLGGAQLGSSSLVYDYLATQSELLASSTLIQEAIDRGQLETLSGYADDVAAFNLDVPGERRQAIERVSMRIKGDLLIRQVLKDQKPTQILDLQLKGASPSDCARVLNSLIEAYKDFHRRNQRSTAKEALETLFKNKRELEQQYAEQAKALKDRRQKDKIIGGVGGSVPGRKYDELGGQLIRLELERAEAENFFTTLRKIKERNPEARELIENLYDLRVNRPQNLQARYNFDPIKRNELQSELELEDSRQRELAQSIGEKHPDYLASVRRADGIKKKLERFDASEKSYNLAVVDNLVEAARLRSEDLTGKVNRLKEEFETARSDALEHSSKTAEFEAGVAEIRKTENLQAALIDRIKSVQITEDYDSLKITVMEVPASIGQVEPKPIRVAALGGLIGTLLGLGIAYLISALDNSIRSPEELQDLTGAPVLGVVPIIDNRRGMAYVMSGRWVETHSRSSEAEAYRTVRTAIHFGRLTRGAKCLLITSPTQGDGKSTTTANLAASMAQNGLRVLLVEADLRRPVQHKVYELDPSIGITSALTGNANIEDIIVRTPLANLDLAPAGPVPPNPTELLNSPEFDKFLKRARNTYDRILIDSPPMLLVADASVLASHVDGVIMVVNGDRATKRSVTETARTILSVGGKLIGVIVNMVDPREQRYYQYYYYGSYYNNYYRARGQDEGRTPPPPGPGGSAAAAPPPLAPPPTPMDSDPESPRSQDERV